MYYITILLGLLVLGVIYGVHQKKKKSHREEELLKDRVAYLNYLQKEIREEDLTKEKTAYIIYHLFEDTTVYSLYRDKDYIALKEGIKGYAARVRSEDLDSEEEKKIQDIEKMNHMKESLKEDLEEDGVLGILRNYTRDRKRYEEDLKYFIYFSESGIF